MTVRFHNFWLIITLVTITGLNWSLLQTVAWTSMLANNLRTQSLSEAMTRTFDGQYPCPLCRAIAEAKKSERKSAILSASRKLEFPPLTEGLALLPPPHSFLDPQVHALAGVVRQKPPLPPPRPSLV